MGNTLDDLKSALSKLAAITRQLAQKDYPFDLKRLNVALQAIFEGRFEAVGGVFPSMIHAADLIPEGWTVVEDVPSTEFEVKSLNFVSFLEKREEYISGEEMRRRAVTLRDNLGLCDAERILKCQADIPVELRGKYIVLPGTLLRSPGGNLRVPDLGWGSGRWVLDFGWLGDYWRGSGRLARCK